MTADRGRYTLRTEPRDELYRRLLELGAQGGMRALLVVRDGLGLKASGTRTQAALAPFVRSEERRSEWPGTELMAEQATVFEIELSLAVVPILVGAVDGLFEWQQPAQPEDLCLLRPDGSAWLTTIAHERDAYLSLSPDEAHDLETRAPWLWRVLRRDPA